MWSKIQDVQNNEVKQTYEISVAWFSITNSYKL